jgi:hypothetical protein
VRCGGRVLHHTLPPGAVATFVLELPEKPASTLR